ncbi:tRNA (N6-isopentenyl adenosine(37)-C2)-methylthiotransferase MiaB [Thermoclostridium stercorarium]|jgi:tRNA-2-methylthio-N6-dimethylallyladenosine synthase|uniref:tRNA-2-methylthio-N(6)-dimethylallyladenosine synthase n=1 Tax=Thermoclostridium stercorarium subsp. leptospartum DSM 9219 TaxID=1346611 RepID=A0A1B1YJ60_THEST|nr:tRNA (N6-isopentenyl adenosine(37)-C2)-methylthiotransferase MiaB [Thermoclostridium stercorarium]ANX00808.1 tRNA-2-methylthio-N(6)-dimethylallyladenosine synthase MiaB [Thermoclostridium stercorarium subsp. leptospartum DSM 9219]UZQ86424.1 tRNA (N6-isopentenyl adenosine(37)-C2)-methylthiotransferase MiaB [Thermoclostridium stercorarium]
MAERKVMERNEELIQRQYVYIDKVKEIISEKANNEGRQPTYEVKVFGCQMNELESEQLAGMLEEMGFTKAAPGEQADIIVFDTCCVRENAEEKIYGNLGFLKSMLDNKKSIIAITGCMMQQSHVVERIKKSYQHVGIVFGTHNLFTFPELLYKHLTRQERIFDVWDSEGQIVEGTPISRSDKVKAYVSIMQGCNNFCSYCIVPYVRGRERSRKKEDIMDEVKRLAEAGYKEITLLGQNVNSYGNDLGKKDAFADLLYSLNEIDGIERIRFTTSHPKDLSDSLITAMKELPKVCEHLHLPFQAGSTKILRAMNRKYTKEQYLELVDRVRAAVPGISFTTDIIVGFPGETEEDFQDTLDVVKKVRFDQAYMFMYSKRKGTKAAEFENQVPEDVKKERFQRLVELQNAIVAEINKTYEGRTVEVLVEGISRNNDKMYTGRTRNYKLVNFPANEDLTGKLVRVKIVRAWPFWLEGAVIPEGEVS